MISNKVIFLTGATGTFGTNLIKKIIKSKKYPKKLILFSRDEWKQSTLKLKYPDTKYKFLRYFLGDIRDKERLSMGLKNVDIIIHSAALKQVDVAEYNPEEFIKTNILGTQNLINISLNSRVSKFISISTDKASSPINLYGASKLCAEKLVTAANNYKGPKNIKFSSIRYGNVLGSRGSILPILISNYQNGKITNITDKRMTRFSTNIDDGLDMVFKVLKNMRGGEIFVQKNKSYKLIDLFNIFYEKKNIIEVGHKHGEKIHEELISLSEMKYTYDLSDYYVIISPNISKLNNFYKNRYKLCGSKMAFTSSNSTFMSKNELLKNILKFTRENKLELRLRKT